ncbi:MAG TPA: glycoside hydrolase family 2 TIM barrel-domain containing protein [Methylomirabilota bacterium]|nr:glycoside hydrolase family 2 TIM barrel-domain containing protein [Methylomirabilota bacterium]
MPNRFAYPRPEYPRPDRQRGTIEGTDWLNLNGPWQFRFDGDWQGEEEKWFKEENEWREQIIVPFCWESLAAWGDGDSAGNDNYYSTRVFKNPLEVTRANHRSAPRYEVGWYRRRVTIPSGPAWDGKRIILTIGAADFCTDCWVNGKHLGQHEGGYTPFEFDIMDALIEKDSAREGLIVLRVEDLMDNHEQPVGKQWKWYTTTSGIWQTVFLEPRGASYIESFRIYPDIDKGEARFELNCVKAAPGSQVLVEFWPPGANNGAHSTLTIPIEDGRGQQAAKMEPLLLWDPNSPNLYDVKFTLRSGSVTHDVVRSYFGMRKIDFEESDDPHAPPQLRLNGVARYLRGALYQSYHPEGVYTASDVAVLKKDIQCTKEFGFNFLRIHIKIDDPLLYYWADKLGILLMADMPNFGEGGDTPVGRKRWEVMMREAIKRDFNHPSIFSWCIFNETWGFGGQVELIKHFDQSVPDQKDERENVPHAVSAEPPPGAPPTAAIAPLEKKRMDNVSSHKWVHEMWLLTKSIDPTRLVEDMSVCHWDHLDYFAHTETDINSWHFYINDYQKAKEHIRKIVESTYAGSSFNYVQGFQHKGTPLINSDYGGIGALDGDVDMSWSFKFLTNELRRYQQISAYIYTELHDVEWEYNGFLNYDRTPKEIGYDPRVINESDALPIDAPPIAKLAHGESIKVDIASSHYSTQPKKNIMLHWRMGGVDTRGRFQQDLARGGLPIEFPHRRVAPAYSVPLTMPRETMLCSLTVEAKNELGIVVAQNYIDFFVSDGYPKSFENLADRSLVLRGPPSDWERAEWSEGHADRDRARAEDHCWGHGRGFFEWKLPLHGRDLAKARRIRVLAEASSHRTDMPQTDEDIYPTTLQMFLNDIRVFEGVLRNHPHDSRGVLSYLRGGKGAYGYLVHAYAERKTLQHIAAAVREDHLRLRCAVPENAMAHGGLTIYGAECGRYPVSPTIIVEW